MTAHALISNLVFARAQAADRDHGLLGFVTFDVGLLQLDGVAVRCSRAGKVVLSFPERRDRHGVAHDIVRPVDDAARQALTAAVIDALNLQHQGGP